MLPEVRDFQIEPPNGLFQSPDEAKRSSSFINATGGERIAESLCSSHLVPDGSMTSPPHRNTRMSANTASNGAKSCDCNGHEASKRPKPALQPKGSNGDGLNRNKTSDTVVANDSHSKTSPIENGSTGSVKTDLSEGRGSLRVEKVRDHSELDNSGLHGHSVIAGPKRKSQDSCILFSQDAPSLEKVEELKEGLEKEAISVLRSCGWADEVYSFMRSRKRLCVEQVGTTRNGDEAKNSMGSRLRQNFQVAEIFVLGTFADSLVITCSCYPPEHARHLVMIQHEEGLTHLETYLLVIMALDCMNIVLLFFFLFFLFFFLFFMLDDKSSY